MKVAIIDDDEIVIEMASIALQDMGHEVVSRSSAVGAAFWIQEEAPNIVLVDLHMPLLPGDAWLELVVEENLLTGDNDRPAFVVFSSKDVDELERVVRETCAVGYIRKNEGFDRFAAAFEKIVAEIP